MTLSSNPSNEFYEKNDFPSEEISESINNPVSLSGDPDFDKLIEHLQKGEKDLATMVFNTIEKRYPGHPELLKIKDELEMKASVNDLGKKIEKGEKREQRKEFLRLAIFAVAGTILVMGAFYFASVFLLGNVAEEDVEKYNSQLTSLQTQAEQLLDRGRPEPASEIVETMREIDPDWEALPDLTARTETLLALEADYDRAVSLAEQGQNADALALFQSIEAVEPGLWDVRSRIAAMEAKVQVSTFLEEGAAAFQAEEWAGVISAYESALDMDPSIDDARVKEQLIQAYVNEITVVVEADNPSLDVIENAEGYYRRAVSLIPQGGEFSAQRTRLDELNTAIKELKYIRMARDIFGDPLQTTRTVGNAVNYLSQAAGLNPRNTALQSDLQNARAYREGFQDFVTMDWEDAIENLNQILGSNSAFLQSHARVLLYESYYGLGKQYASEGLFEEALLALEEAENLAFEDRDNLLKLFQVQLLICDIFRQQGNPGAAFSAYQDAFTNNNIVDRLAAFPEVEREYIEAISFADNELYENAYENIQSVFDNISEIYTYTEVTVNNGTCLAFIADINKGTINAINQVNNLPNDVVVTFGGILQVPRIEN